MAELRQVRQVRQVRRSLWASALLPLVAAVLLGLVGMHGLGPVTVFQPRHVVAGHGGDMPSVSPHCHHNGDGHSLHGDEHCVAVGVSNGPVLSVPLAAQVSAAVAMPVVERPFRASSTGRAPPSLAQLQLLRI